ncbi:outer membrane protein [Escherichia coli]|uniref:Outer membrane protein n=1 Tax=Escherichia coli TaxID=562 RepID=A0A377E2C5_ECOLX|nr:outer membrane protein [Escherichia coli]
MIKRTLLAAAIFSALPAYAGLTSITRATILPIILAIMATVI